MTVHKLTAGDGYTYLTRQVAANDTAAEGRDGLSAYYTATGEAPGQWMGRGLDGLGGPPLSATVSEAQMSALFGEGRHPDRRRIEREHLAAGTTPFEADHASRLGAPYRVFTDSNEFRRRCAVEFRELNSARGLPGNTPIADDDRARIRTSLATEMFSEAFGRPLADQRELSGHLARISRQRTTAVAGYDLTFSPVKSVSTLWAIAPPDVAGTIERAHADAVADVLAWLEDHAVFSRTGHNGVAQVDVHGVLAAAFTHRDSRAGDPDLHTHVAISNKVKTLDGRWLALDGRAIYKNNVAASERYNTRMEALLIERLGVRFSERSDGEPGKRPVREIVGIDGPLPRLWSSRRADIDSRRATLSATFQADHGRPPTAKEAIHLAQQANLETRQAKHEPRPHADQRATWRSEALSVLGSADDLQRYIDRAVAPRARTAGPQVTNRWVDDVARAVVDRVALTRATWSETHLRAEAERHARSAGVSAANLDGAVDQVVASALSPPHSLRLMTDRDEGEPEALRRRDGTSVFRVAGAAVHTSEAILHAEHEVIEQAARFDGRVTPPSVVDGVLASAADSGPVLNPGQVDFVRALAGSGARVQVALAPAGTGKTTALRALADAWRAGGGTVVGLAPSAAASSVLRHQLGDSTDTVAKFVHAHQTGVDVPEWLRTLDAGSLVVVDEAGAASTHDLACVVRAVVRTGGSVRLVGDDQQLGPIGAGGLLRDLAAAHGAVRLDEVVRFTHADTGAPNTVEGAASLALRDGDPTALAYYADHGRLHVGDLASCISQVYDAWSADRAVGRDALMLAPTRELVQELNVRARTDRLAQVGPPSADVVLADGTTASAGDVVMSRRNARTLASGDSTWVTNGDRWTIAAVRPSGALDVVHTATASLVTLPPDYVRAHVTLGYATTVHGAQGVTADASYTVVSGSESRQLLYVALTRGRHSNHAFVTVTGDGDAHDVITPDGVLPPTAIEVLQRVLSRDQAALSATTSSARETDPELQLPDEVDRYLHAVATAAQDMVGAAAMSAIDRAADTVVPGLTDEPAYPTLRAHLALIAVAGQDPLSSLRRSVNRPRGLADARDIAAVLDWRMGPRPSDGETPPLCWLPAVPYALAGEPQWGRYLGLRSARVTELSTAVRRTAAGWTADTVPAWAQPFLSDGDLLEELAVWRTALRVDPADPRPTGGPCGTAAQDKARRDLDDRVHRHLAPESGATARLAATLRGVAPGITDDPFWPVLISRLAEAGRNDPDGSLLLNQVTAKPLPDELPAAALWWRLLEHLPGAADDRPGPDRVAAQPDVHVTPDVGPACPADGSRTSASSGEPPQGPSRERVLDLNQQAATFFADSYDGSWAQQYLTDRLGSDPSRDTTHVVGLAPRGWTVLVEHLRQRGATDDELVAAGLATRTTAGRVIDRFRDRVVFAIRDDDGVVGWIGRRHPAADRQPHPAVPKYLNTPETIAFTKGHHLFGLADSRTALDRGAAPVLVEGPLDALAVTLAGDGTFVGVAPLGTAFTTEQATRLRPFLHQGRHGPIVAMDADEAGRRAAERIFWQTGQPDARAILLPEGQDPAGLLQAGGHRALLDALASHVDLAGVLVNRRIDALEQRLSTVEGQVVAARRSAEVIAAVRIPQWPALLTQVVARTGLAPDIVLAEVFAAADPHEQSVERSDTRGAPATTADTTRFPMAATNGAWRSAEAREHGRAAKPR